MAKWTFEPGHTAAEFRARHMGIVVGNDIDINIMRKRFWKTSDDLFLDRFVEFV